MRRNYSNGLGLAAALILAGCTTMEKTKLNNAKLASEKPANALAFQANSSFAKGLSDKEIENLTAAELQALEYGKSGEEIKWIGDKKTVSGSVIAFQPFRVGQSNCRRFEHQMVDVRNKKSASGTACKRSDEPWKLVQ